MAKGWIAVHRQLQDHWLWDEKPFSKGQAWIDLLMMANRCDRKFLLGSELINVQAGDVVTSIAKLCDRWGWSNNKVVRFLKLLEEDKMIIKKSDAKKTVITIENYSKYSVMQNEKAMPERCESDGEAMPERCESTQTTIINNDKQLKQSKGRFKPPTVEEVRAYCQERKNSINPEAFVAHYTSNGWMVGKNKMKDWKAAVRSWESRQEKKTAPAVRTSQDMTDLDDVF